MEENRPDQLSQSSNSEAIGENDIRIVIPIEENTRRLYEASKTGSIEDLKILIQEDPDIVHQVLVSPSNVESPLHLSVSHGHLEFTQLLLDQKPELAGEVDTLQRTPLHLASANGETEIVRALLEKNTSICLVRDLNGLIPLHYAVIRGKIEIIQELINARPQSVWTKLGNAQSVLHLCVKHRHLEALKLLTEMLVIHDERFLNATDDSGNTILDLSLMLRQVEMVRYLLSIPGIETGTSTLADITPSDDATRRCSRIRSSIHSNSNTAGVQRTENFQVHQSSVAAATKQRGCWQGLKKFMKYKGDWLEEVQNTMMLVATVIATVTFQGSINPPGGVWQQDTQYNDTSLTRKYYDQVPMNTVFLAGTPIMAYQQPKIYWFYSLANTISFVASVSVILLIISRFPLRNRICGWILTLAMCAAVIFLLVTYLQGIRIFRFFDINSPLGEGIIRLPMEVHVIIVLALVGIIEVVGLWYMIHFFIWVWKKGLSKFTSRLPVLHPRFHYLYVYVFVCMCCAGALILAFYKLVGPITFLT